MPWSGRSMFARLSLTVAIALLALISPTAQSPSSIAFVNARIIDGSGNEPFVGTLVVSGSRIAAVGRTAEVPAGAATIDAAGHTILPGLVDLQVELGGGGPWNPTDVSRRLAALLYSGVTSVVGFGIEPARYDAAVALGATATSGARLLAGARTTDATGSPDTLLRYGPQVLLLRNGPNEALPDAVRQLATDARSRGTRLMSAAWEPSAAQQAIELGATVIVSPIAAGDTTALAPVLVQRNVTAAPVLSIGAPAASLQPTALARELHQGTSTAQGTPAGGGGPSAAAGQATGSVPTSTGAWPQALQAVKGLRSQRVRLAVASGASPSFEPFGWTTHVAVRLLADAGLSPLEAVTAATSGGAWAIGAQSDRGFLAPGMRADLLMVRGDPSARIQDLEQIARVFLDGQEVNRGALRGRVKPPPAVTETAAPSSAEAPVTTAAEAALPPRRGRRGARAAGASLSQPLLDDFERGDDRSTLGPAWQSSSEHGDRPTTIVMGRVVRGLRDHALHLTARMGAGPQTFARASLPLTDGNRPVDVSRYRGIRFDARGEGRYRLVFVTSGVTDGRFHESYFSGSPDWTPVGIPFASVGQNGTGSRVRWTGQDLVEVRFEIIRDPGKLAWLELDNVRFY